MGTRDVMASPDIHGLHRLPWINELSMVVLCLSMVKVPFGDVVLVPPGVFVRNRDDEKNWKENKTERL
jgi:hypothetical protein